MGHTFQVECPILVRFGHSSKMGHTTMSHFKQGKAVTVPEQVECPIIVRFGHSSKIWLIRLKWDIVLCFSVARVEPSRWRMVTQNDDVVI